MPKPLFLIFTLCCIYVKVKSMGPDGGKVSLIQDTRCRATFPKHALHKKIKVGLQVEFLLVFFFLRFSFSSSSFSSSFQGLKLSKYKVYIRFIYLYELINSFLKSFKYLQEQFLSSQVYLSPGTDLIFLGLFISKYIPYLFLRFLYLNIQILSVSKVYISPGTDLICF